MSTTTTISPVIIIIPIFVVAPSQTMEEPVVVDPASPATAKGIQPTPTSISWANYENDHSSYISKWSY